VQVKDTVNIKIEKTPEEKVRNQISSKFCFLIMKQKIVLVMYKVDNSIVFKAYLNEHKGVWTQLCTGTRRHEHQCGNFSFK